EPGPRGQAPVRRRVRRPAPPITARPPRLRARPAPAVPVRLPAEPVRGNSRAGATGGAGATAGALMRGGDGCPAVMPPTSVGARPGAEADGVLGAGGCLAGWLATGRAGG